MVKIIPTLVTELYRHHISFSKEKTNLSEAYIGISLFTIEATTVLTSSKARFIRGAFVCNTFISLLISFLKKENLTDIVKDEGGIKSLILSR